jgi:hypothetical protein
VTRGFSADDRGVSVTVNYVLNLALAVLLVGGVLTATAGVVEDRRESAVRTELSVVGERLVADLAAADRLAVVGEGPNEAVAVSVSLPDRVAAKSYDVQITASPGDSTVVLRTENPDVAVTVGFRNETAVRNATVDGGDLRVVLDTGPDPGPADDRLEVSEA